jgi:hypothetical protein
MPCLAVTEEDAAVDFRTSIAISVTRWLRAESRTNGLTHTTVA